MTASTAKLLNSVICAAQFRLRCLKNSTLIQPAACAADLIKRFIFKHLGKSLAELPPCKLAMKRRRESVCISRGCAKRITVGVEEVPTILFFSEPPSKMIATCNLLAAFYYEVYCSIGYKGCSRVFYANLQPPLDSKGHWNSVPTRCLTMSSTESRRAAQPLCLT